MTKHEIERRISSNGVPVRTVRMIVNEFLSIIQESVRNGDDVTLSNFGTFTAKSWSGRQVTDLNTDECVEIGDKRTPRFVPSKKFRTIINE